MGNRNGKINTDIPIDTIIKRIDDCILPDEKEVALDYLEMLEAKLEVKSQRKINCKILHETKGIPVIISVLKNLLRDEMATRMGVSIFELLKEVQFAIMDLIVYGGLEWLNKVKVEYEKDEFLSIAVPKLLKTVLEIGASAAIGEIVRETTNLQLCHTCQEAIERSRLLKTSVSKVHIPHCSERVNRVTMFMVNYEDKLNVLVPGLEAIIAFTKNADCPTSLQDTKVIKVCANLLTLFPKQSSIVWRVSLIFSKLALISDEVACQIVDTDVTEVAVGCFHSFNNDCRTRQQIFWMLNALLRWPRSRYGIQTSKQTMLFLKKIVDDSHLPMDSELAKKFNPFELVIPLFIRSFIRETHGEILFKKKPKVQVRKGPQRRILPHKPVFGTVDTAIFVEGEAGLVGADAEEEKELAAAREAEEAPWEEHLSYGVPMKDVKSKKQPGTSGLGVSSKGSNRQ